VAFVRDSAGEESLLTASLDGSGERVLASYKPPEDIVPYRVAWSPDGKTLAFVPRTPQQVLTTIAAEGGPPKPVAGGHWNYINDLMWLPGSQHLVVISGSQLYEASLERGEARQITQGLSRYTAVRASADGKTLLVLQNQILATIQVSTLGKESAAKTLSAENQSYDGMAGLAWTPDGKIVYRSLRNGRRDLWEMGADGSNRQRLTNNGASSDSVYPAVSTHGGFVAFIQYDEGGQSDVWRIDLDGTNLKRLTQGKQDDSPTISPDGQWVVFERGESGKYFLMGVPSGGGPAVQLTDYTSSWPSFSRDGKWIACAYAPTLNQPVSLAMIPFAGGQPSKVFPLPAGSDWRFVWTPDSAAIAFVGTGGGVDNIWEQPVAGGPASPVTHFTSDKIFWFDWSRDGRLALSRGTEPTDAVLIRNFR
jgi:Tol biopolymer transport system component